MWPTTPNASISATNSLSLQLAVPIDLLYTGGTPPPASWTADLLRRACAQPRARPRSPHGNVALVNAPGSDHVTLRTSFSGTRAHRHDLRQPRTRLLRRCFDVARLRPHGPVFRLAFLQLSPERAHSPDRLLRCSNHPPFRPVPRSKPPRACISTTVPNPCTRVIHHILTRRRSRAASTEHSTSPDGCLLRRGSDVSAAVRSSIPLWELWPEPAYSLDPPDHWDLRAQLPTPMWQLHDRLPRTGQDATYHFDCPEQGTPLAAPCQELKTGCAPVHNET